MFSYFLALIVNISPPRTDAITSDLFSVKITTNYDPPEQETPPRRRKGGGSRLRSLEAVT